MNRAEATRQVMLLEAAAGRLKEHAKTLRLDLDADARAELAEQGTAPTWRLDLGTWSLPVSKEAATITDGAALVGWCKRRYPSEIVEVVNPAFQEALLRRLRLDADVAVDPSTGEVVPGVGVRPAGVPQSLRFRPAGDALAVADQAAAALVGEVAAGLGIALPGGEA